jgi:hypothetical protein
MMKRRLKLVTLAIVTVIAIVLILTGSINNAVNPKDGQQALAIDQPVSRISPELKEAVARAGPTELISTWVEFDGDEFENKTGYRIPTLVRKCATTLEEKLGRKAFNELLPEEIAVYVRGVGQGVEPPVELKQRQRYLVWYMIDLLPSMIKSIDGFAGIEKLTLCKPSPEAYGITPLLASLMTKVADEYPTYRITLVVDLKEQYDYQKGGFFCDYENAIKVIEKNGGTIIQCLTPVHSMIAEVPPSFELVKELSALDEVSEILPNEISSIS